MKEERTSPPPKPEDAVSPTKNRRDRERVEASTTFTREELRLPDARRLIFYRFPGAGSATSPGHKREQSGV